SGGRDAVGARLARTVTSPTRSSAGRRAAWAAAARSARADGSAPQAASAAMAAAAIAILRMRVGCSVIGRRQLAATAGCRPDRTRDQAAQVAGLERFDRGLGGAAGRGDAAPEFGRRLAGFDQ